MNKFAKVLIPLPFNQAFDYKIAEGKSYSAGDYVKVPFRNKELIGIVTEALTDSEIENKSKIKEIIGLADEGFGEVFPLKLMELINWQSDYYVSELGKVLSLCYSAKFFRTLKRKVKISPDKYIETVPLQLSEDQKKVADELINNSDAFSVTLLEGVTGSGKTEVYFEVIEKIISQGKQALILLPEISLTSSILERFKKKFGFSPVLWHSTISDAKKRNSFFKIAKGEARVVIGARSALHLPFKNLGLIIVDEEHDSSYKQEDQIIYNARDVAIMRGKIEDFSVILSTATPSIETYNNAKTGKYKHYKLESRFNKFELPEVQMIDMRTEKISATEFISTKLRAEIKHNLDNNLQSLLFLNRKGYAPLVLCSKCGFRFKSPDTSSWLVMHKDSSGKSFLKCHHSDFKMPMPEICPSCNAEKSFRVCGPGIQRLAEEIRILFPSARVKEISSEISSERELAELISKIEYNEVDILIGTQIIAKGHNFPSLSLVGVIDGDLGLDFSDLRSSEKSFQLLHQVSGRAGRAQHKGRVFVQTYQPDHFVMQCLKENNLQKFMDYELDQRKKAGMPPFSKLCSLIISGATDADAKKFANEIISKFERVREVAIFGPAVATYHEYRGSFRYRILLKCARNFNLQKYVRGNLEKFYTAAKQNNNFKDLKIKIDIDPYGLG
jgi:primosomal protein N' (replication factor Y)